MTPGFSADAVRTWRRASKKTLRGLAAELGVTHQAVHHWETGVASPSADSLPLLASALGCRIDDLFILVAAGDIT